MHLEVIKHNSNISLTDKVMEYCVFSVILWDGVFCIQYSQLGWVFKWVFHKTQEEQSTPKGLQNINIIFKQSIEKLPKDLTIAIQYYTNVFDS